LEEILRFFYINDEDSLEIFRDNNLIFEYPFDDDLEFDFNNFLNHLKIDEVYQAIVNDNTNYFWIILNSSKEKN
jgi:hypothetical protein